MIVSLRGPLIKKSDEAVVIEAAGVGYQVSVAGGLSSRWPSLGREVLVYVAESVAMYGGGTTLYGFLTEEERVFFNTLRENVPGTGAKKALELMEKANKSLSDFKRAVTRKDARALVTLFGFTVKTAEKLVNALFDKLDATFLPSDPTDARLDVAEEAVAGLVALGYREPAARSAVQSVLAVGGAPGSDVLIRESLRHLSGRS